MRDFELKRPHRPAPRQDPSRASDAGVSAFARSGALDPASILELQRSAGNASVVQLLSDDEERSPVHDVVGSGGGQPLDPAVRAPMEAAFGASFEGVRVHTGDKATKSAESVGAAAYTVGSDVVFRGGFDPSSPVGQRTLAHELTHVVQQSSGPVSGTPAPGGIQLSDPSDRFEREADQTADEVMSSVQRHVGPEEDEGSEAG